MRKVSRERNVELKPEQETYSKVEQKRNRKRNDDMRIDYIDSQCLDVLVSWRYCSERARGQKTGDQGYFDLIEVCKTYC